MPGNFFDTNVLVYLASGDAAKADRAEQLIANGGTISIQVLNEITNVARRKMGLTGREVHAFLTLIRGLLQLEAITVAIHELGLALSERYGFSVYDAMIVASALQSGCNVLWSEDMQDGLLVDGRLTIVNPFR